MTMNVLLLRNPDGDVVSAVSTDDVDDAKARVLALAPDLAVDVVTVNTVDEFEESMWS